MAVDVGPAHCPDRLILVREENWITGNHRKHLKCKRHGFSDERHGVLTILPQMCGSKCFVFGVHSVR